MAKHIIVIPDEMELVIEAEAAKAGLTPDGYLQIEVDKRIAQILNAFVSDNTGLTEVEVFELHKTFALAKSNYLAVK